MAQTKCGFDNAPGVPPGGQQLILMGPTLMVDIGFDSGYRPGALPTVSVKGLAALVDTGAAECCIDSLLAAQLKLPIVDKRPISGVGGTQQVNMHLAQVHVPSLLFTMYGMFAGVHLKAGGQFHWVLLGRTFLQGFTMVYEGKTGTVTLSS